MNTSTLRAHWLKRLVGAAVLGTLMLGVMAACGAEGNGGEDPSVEPTTPAPTTEVSEPDPTETEESPMPEETTPHLDPSMGSDKPGSATEKTISGTVESGVESGCLVLKHNGTVYGIFGDYDPDVVYAGAEVTLHGHVDKDMMSFCQQGTPFVVKDAESAA